MVTSGYLREAGRRGGGRKEVMIYFILCMCPSELVGFFLFIGVIE